MELSQIPAKIPASLKRVPARRHNARLDFRLSDEAKARIEKAALVSGQSLSDFAASTLTREANEVLASYEATTLSDRDRDLFLALLDAQDAPNQALKATFARYRGGEVVGSRYFLPGENPQQSHDQGEDKGEDKGAA